MKCLYLVLLALRTATAITSTSHTSLCRIKFYLYTRQNAHHPTKIAFDNIDLIMLDVTKPTKLIVHGWKQNAQVDWYETIKDEYLQKDDYNIIQVDWSKYAQKDYWKAARSTQQAGTIIGNVISYLHVKYGLLLNATHIIGNGLGAHVGGHAGKRVEEVTGVKLWRITALDAAECLFGSPPIFEPLLKSDAEVVDAIHTHWETFGYWKPRGTVDFYPNGGRHRQAKCGAVYGDDIGGCNHDVGVFYFIQSINNVEYVSTKCESWHHYMMGVCDHNPKSLMGEGYTYTPESTGKHYLTIN